jgi:hypothetical protein
MAMPDRGAGFAGDWLSRSWRDAVADLNVDIDSLNRLSEQYLRNKSRQLTEDNTVNEVKLANDKGNLKKEIENDHYTAKVWLKLWRIIRPKTMTLTVNAEWHDGKKLNGGKGFTYLPLEDLDDPENPTIKEDEIDEEFIANFIQAFKDKHEGGNPYDGENEVISKHIHLDTIDVK